MFYKANNTFVIQRTELHFGKLEIKLILNKII